MLIEGDFTSEDVLDAAGIETCDLFIAVSENDENNILGALLAKKLGAGKTIALVNRKAYGDLMQGSQIDITLSTTTAALGELIRHVRRGGRLQPETRRGRSARNRRPRRPQKLQGRRQAHRQHLAARRLRHRSPDPRQR